MKCTKGFSRKIHFNKHKCAVNMKNPEKILKNERINIIGDSDSDNDDDIDNDDNLNLPPPV